MRTTVELPDELFRQLKTTAIQRGTTLKELLRLAVERELAEARRATEPYQVPFPLLDSKEPGMLNFTNADIKDLLT